MTRPSTPTDVLKSMVDHPAGRHRRSITIPPAVSCHGTRHDQIGHARAERDAAPGDTGLFDALGLVLCLLGLFFLIAVAAVIGWHAAGTVGAVIGAAATILFIHFFIRSLS